MTEKIPVKEDIEKELGEVLAGGNLVVACMGPKQSGKTTTCDVLSKEFGGTKLSFVTELKAIVKNAFDFTDDQMTKDKDTEPMHGKIRFAEKQLNRVLRAMSDSLDKANPKNDFRWMSIAANQWVPKEFKTPREVMQWVGTELMHTIYPNFHCEMLTSKMGSNGLYFIDDLRFVSEYEYLLKSAPIVKVIRIVGRNEVKEGKEEHASESNWKSIKQDYTLDNSDTLTKFKNNARHTFKKMINEVHKDVKEGNVDFSIKIDNIIGDTNETNTKTVRVGKFVFEKAR